MTKILITLIVMMLFALLASAQDEAPADSTTATEVDEATTAEQADASEVEDADLDEQKYEQDEDDFIPTEEIPADEPIPFPTNI
jgi:hypothetical protein